LRGGGQSVAPGVTAAKEKEWEAQPVSSRQTFLSFFRSSKGRLLFALRGRIPRVDFWVGLAVVAGMTTLAVFLNGNRVREGELGKFFTLVTIIAVLSPYCLTAIVVKRLHDIDRSGWNALVLFVALFLAGLAAMAYGGLQQNEVVDAEWRWFWTNVFYVAAGLAVVLIACLIVKLGFAGGTLGPNRFGPDPAGPSEQPKMFLKLFTEVWDEKGGLAALDLADERFDAEALSGEVRQSIAARISELALHDLYEEDLTGSETVLLRMLDFAEARFGEQHYSVATISNAIGRALIADRRDAEAEPHLLRALAINEALARDHPGHRFYPSHELGNLVGRYEAASRLDLAVGLLERRVAILGVKATNPRAARALLDLGKAYVQQGRQADAAANLREALAFFDKQPPTKGVNYNLYAQIARDLLAGIPDSE
jgi:uncharacterized membrane protein YhaH (DUF805 family)